MSWKEAHKRLLEKLPIRTVKAKRPEPKHQGGTILREQTIMLRRRVKELKAQGWTRRQIAAELNVSLTTVTTHTHGESL